MLFDIEYPITCHNKLVWNSANDKPVFAGDFTQ